MKKTKYFKKKRKAFEYCSQQEELGRRPDIKHIAETGNRRWRVRCRGKKK